MKDTKIISAFPCCGKTYCYENNTDLTILDSDSSGFSWVKDEQGNNTKERHPDFPNNYVAHIKENIGKADIIFVSSHEQVRIAMTEADLSFLTVYPECNMKDEWKRRMESRGNEKPFIDFIMNNWDDFQKEIRTGCNSGNGIVWLNDTNKYIANLSDYLN